MRTAGGSQPIAALGPEELRQQWRDGEPSAPSYESWWNGQLPPGEAHFYPLWLHSVASA